MGGESTCLFVIPEEPGVNRVSNFGLIFAPSAHVNTEIPESRIWNYTMFSYVNFADVVCISQNPIWLEFFGSPFSEFRYHIWRDIAEYMYYMAQCVSLSVLPYLYFLNDPPPRCSGRCIVEVVKFLIITPQKVSVKVASKLDGLI